MLKLRQQKKLLATMRPESVPADKKAEYQELMNAVVMLGKIAEKYGAHKYSATDSEDLEDGEEDDLEDPEEGEMNHQKMWTSTDLRKKQEPSKIITKPRDDHDGAEFKFMEKTLIEFGDLLGERLAKFFESLGYTADKVEYQPISAELEDDLKDRR
jgi:uncharacterized protein YbaA (DUF1428 family)